MPSPVPVRSKARHRTTLHCMSPGLCRAAGMTRWSPSVGKILDVRRVPRHVSWTAATAERLTATCYCGLRMAQDQLVTLATLGTLAGASAATVVVGNTIQSIANYNAKWVALLVAEVIVIAVTFFNGASEASAYFVALLNGCFVYVSAVGLNTMTSPPPSPAPPAQRTIEQAGLPHRKDGFERRFWGRWWG
jgi:hypothetical protein